ncbi:hypothetical protein DCAR_0726775 [Daucus carota subsp. sativus]|uniref:NADH:quinone oxidoreductase/Mrp antiporter transmembrane domain-containing protein n=1 Tax=Daucus carota subsp. sativus TaxID=79200 RepID=A0AAF0XGE5_DAUCS|nr:hypothetical protein DCAR_0726775 [Daucus carota subsp. sativus]
MDKLNYTPLNAQVLKPRALSCTIACYELSSSNRSAPYPDTPPQRVVAFGLFLWINVPMVLEKQFFSSNRSTYHITMAQMKVKRLLAHGSIGHVGYIRTGFSCGTIKGIESLLIDAFAIVSALRQTCVKYIADLGVLAKTNPARAIIQNSLLYNLNFNIIVQLV